MKKFLLITLTASVGLFFPAHARAAVTPVSIAIVPPIQFPPDDFTITGLRASLLWGRHRHVYGVDIGLLGNITELDFVGIGVSGLANYTKGSTTILGLQLAGLANINVQKTTVTGLQMALGVNSNAAQSTVAGLQVALLANLSPFTNVYGAQIGLYNQAQEVYGFQIGLVNSCQNLHGIQIGLVNFHHKGTFVVSPLINVGF